MVDLIRALIQVKTPLTLFAFLSLVFLVAFRTKQVPELFFELSKGKLTKEEFAKLLHRFMLFGFVAFLVLCGMAVVSQVLAYKTQAQVPASEVRDELAKLNASEDQRQEALKEYEAGLAYLQRNEITQAIQALQKSINTAPTIGAQTTLAQTYQKQGEPEKARETVAAAQKLASQQGNEIAQVRLQRISDGGEQGGADGASGTVAAAQTSGTESGSLPSMVGAKKPLPEGGAKCEEAVSTLPGVYIQSHDFDQNRRYYKAFLKAGQTLRVDFRTPDTGGYLEVTIYDADCGNKGSNSAYGSSGLNTVQWTTPANGLVYWSANPWLGNPRANSVYRVSVH
jgi:tetratricopeptide (TPR) repeat protein